MSDSSVKKLSQLLRTKESVIFELEKKLSRLTKKKSVLVEMMADNERLITAKLEVLGLRRHDDACRIYQALLEKTKADDVALLKYFNQPNFLKTQDCQKLLTTAKEIVKLDKGFFFTEAKAEFLLRANPPRQIMQALGYTDIESLLSQENIWEVFCALRFVEDRNWLNDVFFKPYQKLTSADFEEREIRVMVLPEKWLAIGQEFVGKKLHHLSHLKELGLVFIIPFSVNYPGAVLEVLTLILHYLHEVDFYSQLFKRASQTDNFGEQVVKLLQGQVTSEALPNKGKSFSWRIVQRYLAKDDATDPRLLEPHVNPETVHWHKAENDLALWAKIKPAIDLEFWQDLDFVGDFFLIPKGYACPLDGLDHRVINFPVTRQSLRDGFTEMLVSFDLIDNIISLGRQANVESKYLYHQQEALWNEIFIRYFSRDKLTDLIVENLGKGYIELR